jgi:hypothetical protein
MLFLRAMFADLAPEKRALLKTLERAARFKVSEFGSA